MRIISGHFKGRVIPLPDSSVARPTTDKIRQAVFNILEHRLLLKPWGDLIVLDAFAGSGALGLEALSRGAKRITFVEKHSPTGAKLKRFILSLKVDHAFLMLQSFFKADFSTAFDLIFLDPPFHENLWERALLHIQKNNLLSPYGIIYLECETTSNIDVPTGFKILDERSMGRIKMLFLGI